MTFVVPDFLAVSTSLFPGPMVASATFGSPTAIVLGAPLSGYAATKPGFNLQVVTPPRVLQGLSCARDALVNDPSKITVTVMQRRAILQWRIDVTPVHSS